MIGAADVSAGGPDHVRVVTTHLAVSARRRVVRVMRVLIVPRLNGAGQVHGTAGRREEVLTDGRVLWVVSERWLTVPPITSRRPGLRQRRQEVAPRHHLHVAGAFLSSESVVMVDDL